MENQITSYNIASYPSIYAIGHSAIIDIFSSEVLIEEKIDGSQFSFCRKDGELLCRSKGANLVPSNPEKMFEKAVCSVESMDLKDGWIYRGEYLQSEKHNALKYNRIPNNHIIIFDIQRGLEQYLSPQEKREEAMRIGLECVPTLFQGKVDNLEEFKSFLETESWLGGVKIEGVVVKNYSIFTSQKKVSIGKFVSEAFKEVNKSEWAKSNPSRSDLILDLITQYKSEARWRKAIQHLREEGKLDGSPKDIGMLIDEIPRDILKECEEEIKVKLFKEFWPKIKRGVIHGFPEFYKEELAKQAFLTRK